ncbi:MAG: heavy metal-binding domain-containing protein [Bacteroidota bacterium]
MKTQILSLMWMSALFLASCGSTETPSKEKGDGHSQKHDENHQHTYACPMHPDIIGEEGATCPKCGMKLEHNDNAGKNNGDSYFMQFSAAPAEIESGKEATLLFTPKIKGKEDEMVPLDVEHEKKLHLIIVSNDLAYFEHVHPEYQADGSYQIKVLPKEKEFTNGKGQNETRFENGGGYTLFADYVPSGASHQLEKIDLTVKGNPYKEVSFEKERLTFSGEGVTVALEAEGGWITNKQMHIKATVKKGNKTLDAATFDNYLGAKSHMVVLKTGTFEYLHVHPEVENGNLDLHTTFESAGIYRGWLQFQIEGKLIAADFVINVKDGASSTEASSENHEHNHEGHTH